MFLSHTLGGSDVEPLQPCQRGRCEVPCLASIKEDRLHNRLVELGTDFWRSVVRQTDYEPAKAEESRLENKHA